jgi:hypothetical protein
MELVAMKLTSLDAFAIGEGEQAYKTDALSHFSALPFE